MKASRLNLVIALVLAVAAGIAVFAYTSSAKQVVQNTEQVQEVLVAKQVVPIGTTLYEARVQGLLEADKYPLGTLPNGYLTKDVANNDATAKMRVAQVSIAKGMILTGANFGQTSESKPNLGPLQVPAGLFAVSVTLADADHVGTFLVPGVDVSVFCTIEKSPGSSNSKAAANASTTPITVTRLLVNRATVIGVGNAASVAAANANITDGKNSNGLITLAADQTQTQKIIECTRAGQVNLSLVGIGTTPTPDAGAVANDLFQN
jgi:Flp pilus assembly protein CpaB